MLDPFNLPINMAKFDQPTLPPRDLSKWKSLSTKLPGAPNMREFTENEIKTIVADNSIMRGLLIRWLDLSKNERNMTEDEFVRIGLELYDDSEVMIKCPPIK